MNLHLLSLAALLLASYLPAQATVPDHSPSTAFIRSGLPIVDLDQWTEAQVASTRKRKIPGTSNDAIAERRKNHSVRLS